MAKGVQMTKYEATYVKKYNLDGEDAPVTLRVLCAYYINNNWIYSHHWTDESWIDQAKKDGRKRLHQLKTELRNLESILSLLDEVEP